MAGFASDVSLWVSHERYSLTDVSDEENPTTIPSSQFSTRIIRLPTCLRSRRIIESKLCDIVKMKQNQYISGDSRRTRKSGKRILNHEDHRRETSFSTGLDMPLLEASSQSIGKTVESREWQSLPSRCSTFLHRIKSRDRIFARMLSNPDFFSPQKIVPSSLSPATFSSLQTLNVHSKNL